jgi:hypothetical protein
MKASFLGRCAVTVAALIFCVAPARGQISVVAFSGQIAPDTGGARFRWFPNFAEYPGGFVPGVFVYSKPVINNQGVIVFDAELSGGNARRGIFKLYEGQLSPVILKADPVPELAGKTFGMLGPAAINDAGDIVFSGFLYGVPEGPYAAIFMASGATLRRLVDTESEAPGAPGQRFTTFTVVRVNNRGDIAFAALLDNKGPVRDGIFLLTDGVLKTVVLSNQPLMAGTREGFAYPHYLSLNNLGDVVFVGGSVRSGSGRLYGRAVFLFSGGSIAPVAQVGQSVPNSDLVLEALSGPSINDRNEVVFVNGTLYLDRSNLQFLPNGVIRWRANMLEKLAGGGSWDDPQVNNAGSVLLDTTVLDGGKRSVRVREGEVLEGIGKFDWIYSSQLNDKGTLVFASKMSDWSYGIYEQEPNLFIKLFFPQVADGTSGDHSWRTSLTLVNRSTNAATASVNFFGDDGTPLNLSIQGKISSQFKFTIPALGTLRVQTDGVGPLQTGWARIDTDQSLSGIASFAFFVSGERFVSEVGVPSTVDLRSLLLFAESGERISTGIALANPDDRLSVDVTLTLKDTQATPLASHTLTLPPNGHLSKYLSELFPDIPEEFYGRVEVVSTRPIVALALRQRESDFTSLPVIP